MWASRVTDAAIVIIIETTSNKRRLDEAARGDRPENAGCETARQETSRFNQAVHRIVRAGDNT
jgi:hypothetical protein